MKRRLEPWDCARELLQGLPGGLLLTAGAAGRVNPMTIGWGTLGIQWATPIFTVFVRENRFTRQLLDQNPEFTISAPQGEGEGGAKAGIVYLEVERAVTDGVFRPVHIPPHKHGAGGGVADAPAAVAEEGAQPGQVRQLKRVKI